MSELICQLTATQLGRNLLDSEQNVLRSLSPQGIAKFNCDQLSGVPIEQTLSELRLVFGRYCAWRVAMLAAVPLESQRMLNRLKRAPTAEELALFVKQPLNRIVHAVCVRSMQGDSYEDIVEDLAMQFKYELLATVAQQRSVPTRVGTLASTTCPISSDDDDEIGDDEDEDDNEDGDLRHPGDIDSEDEQEEEEAEEAKKVQKLLAQMVRFDFTNSRLAVRLSPMVQWFLPPVPMPAPADEKKSLPEINATKADISEAHAATGCAAPSCTSGILVQGRLAGLNGSRKPSQQWRVRFEGLPSVAKEEL